VWRFDVPALLDSARCQPLCRHGALGARWRAIVVNPSQRGVTRRIALSVVLLNSLLDGCSFATERFEQQAWRHARGHDLSRTRREASSCDRARRPAGDRRTE
jgi:hypothetical protein